MHRELSRSHAGTVILVAIGIYLPAKSDVPPSDPVQAAAQGDNRGLPADKKDLAAFIIKTQRDLLSQQEAAAAATRTAVKTAEKDIKKVGDPALVARLSETKAKAESAKEKIALYKKAYEFAKTEFQERKTEAKSRSDCMSCSPEERKAFEREATDYEETDPKLYAEEVKSTKNDTGLDQALVELEDAGSWAPPMCARAS